MAFLKKLGVMQLFSIGNFLNSTGKKLINFNFVEMAILKA